MSEHRLAAILNADVVGYSRMMSVSEETTLRALARCRTIIEDRVRSHGGRIVNFPGDNVLIEFASAVASVRCAIDIQRAIAQENRQLPEAEGMQFRFGAHLGEVRAEGNEIYGEGVNIAARLEGLAEPGGVCISATVHEQIRNKLELSYQDLGDVRVKNIPDQVRVYRVQLDGTGRGPSARSGAEDVRRRETGRSRLRAAVLGAVAGGLLLGLAFVVFRSREEPATPAPAGDRQAEESTPLPPSGLADVWERIATQPDACILRRAVHPRAPNLVYASSWREGLFKSTDAGATWRSLGGGLPVGSVTALRVDPRDPDVLYVATNAAMAKKKGGVGKSTDGGETWRVLDEGLGSPHVEDLAIDPARPDVLYAGTFMGGVYKSVDGGERWVAANVGIRDFASVTSLAIDPRGNGVVYAGAGHGVVYRSEDGGHTWHAQMEGLAKGIVDVLAIDPSDPDRIFAGLNSPGGGEQPGLFVSEDGARSWRRVDLGMQPVPRILSLAIDPRRPERIFVGTNDLSGVVLASVDGGRSWRTLGMGLGGPPFSLTFDPTSTDTLWAGAFCRGLHRVSLDGSVGSRG